MARINVASPEKKNCRKSIIRAARKAGLFASRAALFARPCSGSASSAAGDGAESASSAAGGGSGNGGEDDSWQRVASFGGAAKTYESNYGRIFTKKSDADLRAIIDQNKLTVDDVRLMVGMFNK